MDSELSCVDKENEIINSVCDSSAKSKSSKIKRFPENEKEAKIFKKGSLLDTYCNTLNESSDFIECELTNKFRNASQKSEKKEFQKGSQVKEVMLCEICKEDITALDVHNRGIHVNKCIDKQIYSASEVITQSSANENTIQSSANDNIFILECPLCFKHFASPELRSSHIKKCGKSKGLSLQSILKALELQERHALERISLGLPAKPVKPAKIPKNPVKKAIVEPKNKAQSDIQLAKALSLSLASSSQQVDAEANDMVSSVILKPPTANQRPGKKVKKIFTPLLVLRSDEERKKLLLDKVESILTSTIESDYSSSADKETDVTMDKQNIVEQELTLWCLSSKSSDKCHYYIEELLDWIKPSDVEMGAKLLHLSQIAGHEIVTQLPCEYTFNAPEENNDTDSQITKVSSTTNQHSSSVIESLSSLVASSWMSDVDIHTACGTVIPAHKLILAVRCPPLKQDSDFCSVKGRACLKWKTVSFDAALQFLNFIYTGNIDVKRDMIYDLFYLANKYEVFDLQTVLHANDVISKTEPKQKIPSTEKEAVDFPSTSCHVNTTENVENNIRESQEDMNMDLEIVYNCLNQSLKPSQSTDTQSSVLNDTVPFKEEREGSVFFSPKSYGSTSLMMVDANDNENDTDNQSLEKAFVCDNFSPKNNNDECVSDSKCSAKTLVFSPKSCGSTSPVMVDNNENDTDNQSLEKAFVCDNFSLKNNNDDECVSDSNCSAKTLVFSPKSCGSTSPVMVDVNDSENDIDNQSLKKAFVCDNFSSKNNDNDECVSESNSNCSAKTLVFSPKTYGSTSSVTVDINDSENDADNRSLEKAVVCDNFSPKNNGSASPVIFDVNDSETDGDNLSDNEITEYMTNNSKKSVLGPSKVEPKLLDINPVESNSSDDSIKFLQSSFVSNNNTYCTPEKSRKSASFSPIHSEITSFSFTIRNSPQNSLMSHQNKHEEKIMPCENSSEALKNAYTELKSPSVSHTQVSNEKKYDLTPDKYNNSHRDISVDLESPFIPFSQRVLSGFYSVSENKTSGITDVKDDLKPFRTDSFVNKMNESPKNINLLKNENITGNSSIPEKDNEANFKLSTKSSLYQSDTFSAIKSDDGDIHTSFVSNSASPEVLICDSDEDPELQGNAKSEALKIHHPYMNFSPKSFRSDINNLANSPSPSSNSSQEDAVFESFHYFDDKISPLNEDHLHIANSSKYSKEKAASSNKNNVQYSKYPILEEHAVPVSSNLQSSKVLRHEKREKSSITVTPNRKSELQQHRFQFSDSPITPFPDYKNMMTPEIKEALKRIGVKALPRKKALAILSHVYDETHPLIDTEMNAASTSGTCDMQSNKEEKVNKSKKRKQTTKNSKEPAKKQHKESQSKRAVLASPESDESGSENPEWLGCVPEMSFSQNNHDSPTKPSKDDIESIKQFIQSDEELYHDVLNYIPLNLVEFHQTLKQNGLKISIQKLMDFLDEQCITFTCPRKEEYKKKQTERAQRFRKKMIAKLSQQAN